MTDLEWGRIGRDDHPYDEMEGRCARERIAEEVARTTVNGIPLADVLRRAAGATRNAATTNDDGKYVKFAAVLRALAETGVSDASV